MIRNTVAFTLSDLLNASHPLTPAFLQADVAGELSGVHVKFDGETFRVNAIPLNLFGRYVTADLKPIDIEKYIRHQIYSRVLVIAKAPLLYLLEWTPTPSTPVDNAEYGIRPYPVEAVKADTIVNLNFGMLDIEKRNNAKRYYVWRYDPANPFGVAVKVDLRRYRRFLTHLKEDATDL